MRTRCSKDTPQLLRPRRACYLNASLDYRNSGLLVSGESARLPGARKVLADQDDRVRPFSWRSSLLAVPWTLNAASRMNADRALRFLVAANASEGRSGLTAG